MFTACFLNIKLNSGYQQSSQVTCSQQGLLTVVKQGKNNLLAGTILGIGGVDDLTVEEALELSDASAERSAKGCTGSLTIATVATNVQSDVDLLKSLIEDNYATATVLSVESLILKPGLTSRVF